MTPASKINFHSNEDTPLLATGYLHFDIGNIPDYCKTMGFELIPLDPVEALNSLQLPQKSNHKDPFDRMLIYQCIKNGYTFVSKDIKIEQYKEVGLKYIW